MPWRALGVRRAAGLEIAESSSTPEWLLLRLGGREAAAVPVLRRVGGFLLAVASGFFTEEELEVKRVANGYLDDEEADSVEVDMVLVDWPQVLYRHLLGGGANPPNGRPM